MGKRMRRGGGSRSPSSRSSSVLDSSVLLRRIVSSKLDSSFDVDAVVRHLRSQYSDYSRIKLQPFSVRVHKTLESLHSQNTPYSAASDNDNDDDDQSSSPSPTPSPKKRHRSDLSEENLMKAESNHLHRHHGRKNDQSLSADSASTCESEDATFGMKFEPDFDITKSMLRERYGNQLKAAKKGKEEDNVEIEVDDGKKSRILRSAEKRGRPDGVLGNEVVVGREWPRFRDLGGMKGAVKELMMRIIVPLCYPQLLRRLGIMPIKGILLHGPPGCGKTTLAHAIANETGVPFYKISATEVVSGVSGASEEFIRDLFKKAYKTAPSLVFIDEIDAIASKRENLQREMERRIVTQLMTCMDEPHETLGSTNANSESEIFAKRPGYVFVIGATNRPDAVDQALRRPGRFDREIALGVPDESARLEILSVLTRNLRLEGEFNLMKITRSTPGFVGTDLTALVNEAGNLALQRIIDRRISEFSSDLKGENSEDWWRQPWTPEEVESLSITMTDFERATTLVQPSSKREGFSSIPSTTWEDVGGLNFLRKEFGRFIVRRIKHPEIYREFRVKREVGFLLYGPPGCGKTLIVKAVANEAGANFIHIKGVEILNKYVGESELAVRNIFSRARTCAPCILFFDEVEALTPKRGKDGGLVVERVLNQLLTELDGVDERQGVYVIGATNRVQAMDPAVLRPGRFGRVLYVPLPSADERGLILKALAREKSIASDVDLDALGRREACQNFSGADLAALMDAAAMIAAEEKQMSLEKGSPCVGPSVIKISHFEEALEDIAPSVSEKQRKHYEAKAQKYNRNRGATCHHAK